jgi:Glycosyl transferases group 1
LQYQAAGLPVVANPVGSHREMIRPGETGFLATTAPDWVQALERLSRDASLRIELGESGRKQVEASYSVAAWAETFVTSVTGMLAGREHPSWKVDRADSTDGRSMFEPHLARTRSSRTLKQIGDR